MPLILQQKPWIVQKYGGTSLGKLLPEITNEIIPQHLQSNHVAVVCSAISGTSKSQGTTSLLLQAIDYSMASTKCHSELNETIDSIRDAHLGACRKIKGEWEKMRNWELEAVLEDCEKGLIEDCEELRSFLSAAQTIGELSPRSKDRVVATGEKLACRIVVASLKCKGIDATLVSLHDIITKAYGNDKHKQLMAYENLGPRFFDALAVEIGLRLEACEKSVPVVTGFFGMMPTSLLQSVGRGYSDLCAAMCAVSTSASELQIWKEVDGIFTADPRRIPSARLLPTVTLEEASELTYYGSEVIHPFTMDQIRNANIPLRLKNVKNPEGSGTIIYPSPCSAYPGTPNSDSITSDSPPSRTSTPSVLTTDAGIASFMSANGYYGESQSRRAPTALTTKDSIVLVNVQSNRQTKSHGSLAQVFVKLNELNAVADLITSSEQSVSLALSSLDSEEKIDRVREGLEKCGKIEMMEDMAIVSVIGHKMRNMVGIAGQIFSTLARGGVNIYLIAQGASEINISLVVKETDSQLAMDIIHTNVLGIPAHSGHVPIVQNGLLKGPWLY